MHFWSYWAKYWHFWPTFDSDLTQTNEIWLRASTHFCREVGYVVNTCFFGLLFCSDLTRQMRFDSDIWVKKWRVKPLNCNVSLKTHAEHEWTNLSFSTPKIFDFKRRNSYKVTRLRMGLTRNKSFRTNRDPWCCTVVSFIRNVSSFTLNQDGLPPPAIYLLGSRRCSSRGSFSLLEVKTDFRWGSASSRLRRCAKFTRLVNLWRCAPSSASPRLLGQLATWAPRTRGHRLATTHTLVVIPMPLFPEVGFKQVWSDIIGTHM